MFEISQEMKDAIDKGGIGSISFFIRPYFDDYALGLYQDGFTSDKFSLDGTCESVLLNSASEDNNYYFINEFDVIAEYNNGDEYVYEPIREVVGHVFGYKINSYELAEDIIHSGGSHSFYLFDGESHILYNFWENFRYILDNPDYRSLLRDISDFEHRMYFATNFSVANELKSPKLDDLILTKLIPNYYEKNGVLIYSVMRTIFQTELTDNFCFGDENYDYDKHYEDLVNSLEYKQIENKNVTIPENEVKMLIKRVNYGFIY